jgi:hypothetical protein
MTAGSNPLTVIGSLRDLARHRLTATRREFDRMVAAGKEPHPLLVIKADRAEYLIQQADEARAAVAQLAEAMKGRIEYAEQSAFEDWMEHAGPSGCVEDVTDKWHESAAFADFADDWCEERAVLAAFEVTP